MRENTESRFARLERDKCSHARIAMIDARLAVVVDEVALKKRIELSQVMQGPGRSYNGAKRFSKSCRTIAARFVGETVGGVCDGAHVIAIGLRRAVIAGAVGEWSAVFVRRCSRGTHLCRRNDL